MRTLGRTIFGESSTLSIDPSTSTPQTIRTTPRVHSPDASRYRAAGAHTRTAPAIGIIARKR